MIYAPQSSPGLRRLPACAIAAFLLFPPAVHAQEVREISVATRLRKEPQGIALVTLPAGTAVESRRTRGAWREVVIEGWIFGSSVSKTTRDGFDLVVRAAGGENIRESPGGPVIARARQGALLRKEEVRGPWTRISRAGWVPAEVVRGERADPTPAVEEPALAGPVESGALPAQAAAPVAADDSVDDAARTEVARETGIFAAPAGGPYGILQSGTPTRILRRSGDWTRVQLEGWVRESDLKAGTGAHLGGVTAAELRADPSKYVGRTVTWRVELLAVQTADELRTEMPRGQLYLLTRGPLPEPGFVYVMVTESQAIEFRSLQALQDLTLRVTIKAPRTRFLATPVVALESRVME